MYVKYIYIYLLVYKFSPELEIMMFSIINIYNTLNWKRNSKQAFWMLIGQLSLTLWLISLFNQEITKAELWINTAYREGLSTDIKNIAFYKNKEKPIFL